LLHRTFGFFETHDPQFLISVLLYPNDILSSQQFVLHTNGQKSLTLSFKIGSTFLHLFFGFFETHDSQSLLSVLLYRNDVLSLHSCGSEVVVGCPLVIVLGFKLGTELGFALELGLPEGKELGSTLPLGEELGLEDGKFVLGTLLGIALGFKLGTELGFALPLGVELGLKDGTTDGLLEGIELFVGTDEGAELGKKLPLGALLGSPHSTLICSQGIIKLYAQNFPSISVKLLKSYA